MDFYQQLGKDCLHYFNDRLSSPNTVSLPRRPLTMVTEVNVGSNQLTEVPVELFQMQSLHVLKLSHNAISSLPTSKDPYTTLYTSAIQRLELDWNQLETLPEDLFRGVANSLEELSVECNQLKGLPPGLWVCPKLRMLKLSRNQLSRLHTLSNPAYYADPGLTKQVISSFTAEERELLCTALPCSSSKEKELKRTEKYLRDVTSFYITVLVTQKPNEILEDHDIYQEVISMHLSRDLFYARTEGEVGEHVYRNSRLLLPSDQEDEVVINRLAKLETVDLSFNCFEELPWDLACIAPYLSKLDLHGNRLVDLDLIHSMPLGLRSLVLDKNQLQCLDRRRVMSLPCGDPLRLLTLPEPNLGNLYCRHCCHDSLSELTNLSLNSNQLSTLPVVGLMTDDNTTDPELQVDIGTVDFLVYYPNLSILSLERNLYRQVPSHLHHLTHLSSLSLSHNRIHELPCEMGLINSQQLLLLKLEGLFLKNIPDRLLHRPTPKHLLSYLKAMLQK